MKAFKLSALSLALAFLSFLSSAQPFRRPQVTVTVAPDAPDWENPYVVGISKEPYHATLDLPSAIPGRSDVQTLDGVWKFRWSPDPWSAPDDFYREDYDCSGWDDIIVPCPWQLQGFGKPIYTNITSPYRIDWPKVTSAPSDTTWYSYAHRNPVGCYVTELDLAAPDSDKHYFLEFGGVKSAMYVWIN